MPPREPQRTPPKTLAMQSSRDMLEKLRREIDRLAGGHVGELVGIEGGVVSGVINLESSGA